MILLIFSIIAMMPNLVETARIGLFASTGCYSHDMLTRNLADRLSISGDHEITIIQIRVYEFNLSLPKIKANCVSFNAMTNSSAQLQKHLQRLMWLAALPPDGNSFNMESVRVLNRLHQVHMNACFRALRDSKFINELRKLNLDLLVVDHLMNDCAVGIAHGLLNVTTIFLSNFPLISSHIDNMGVSSNPSYIPAVIGAEKLPMDIKRRFMNTILYGILLETRRSCYSFARRLFKLALDLDLDGITNVDKRILILATPFEFFLDTPRPMVRGLRYFGCEHCLQNKGNITQELSLPNPRDGFIVVSFGTVTRGDLIPIVHLQRLLRIFSKFPQYTIIWQLDARREYFEGPALAALNWTNFPSHIYIFPWLPLKNLLEDPRVVMLISHGGVTTCIEAVNSGVPILGIAMQGDQSYNLQRIVERGAGEFLQAYKMDEEILHKKMSKMVNENKRYKKAALKLQSMINDHKSLEKSPSLFWLNWASRHFGKNKNHWSQKLIGSNHHSNWLIHCNLDLLFTLLLIFTLPLFVLSA